jgi:ABC-type sulfate transport system permease subunit
MPALLAGLGATFMLVWLAVLILMIVSLWKIFTKAGQPGWASIVPFYNIIVMLQIAGKPLWWLVLLLIPFVNIIFGIILLLALARSFGKGGGFVVGMIFFPFIFYPILAFGDSKYTKPATAA